jgi:hypothetical protein
MKNFPKIAAQIPDVLLPVPGTDLTHWAVIACDQYTSQPDYWRQVAEFVGDQPSTLHLVLPEIFLEEPDLGARVSKIQATMEAYLSQNLFTRMNRLVYLERRLVGKTRHGIMLALDLENYDYHAGSKSLIRATEGTIEARLPPRIKIRAGALLELPHILVLIDDPQDTVFAPLKQAKASLRPLYDFELMFGSGHLQGYAVDNVEAESSIIQALERLADPHQFAQKYGVSLDTPVLLFAMGDGNHSLATAKAIWEQMKSEVGLDHPARYALVEIVNVHDEGLAFEPIHRVLFNVQRDLIHAAQQAFGPRLEVTRLNSPAEMFAIVDRPPRENFHQVGLIQPEGTAVLGIGVPSAHLPVGTLQPFLDEFVQAGGADKIDYIHGQDVVLDLGGKPGQAGFYLPGMAKSDLFKTVILDGALPRKTFSMGAAHEKRFYMESRKITR